MGLPSPRVAFATAGRLNYPTLAVMCARDNSFLEGVEPAFVLMLTCAAAEMSLVPHGLPAIPSPFCIAPNRSRGRRQEGVEPLLYYGVALAGCFFEAGTIENLNVPTMIADKAGPL
jgi:hypothetical protein